MRFQWCRHEADYQQKCTQVYTQHFQSGALCRCAQNIWKVSFGRLTFFLASDKNKARNFFLPRSKVWRCCATRVNYATSRGKCCAQGSSMVQIYLASFCTYIADIELYDCLYMQKHGVLGNPSVQNYRIKVFGIHSAYEEHTQHDRTNMSISDHLKIPCQLSVHYRP